MSLLNRVKRVALAPKEEWPVIAGETTSVGALFSGVVIPLAAIGPVCSALNSLIFGHGIPMTDITYRPSFGAVIGALIVGYVLALLGVYVTAFIVQKLAPTFSSTGDLAQALKLVAFSYAPFWVAGVFYLIPFLGILTLLVGIYSLYLAYVGLPFVMGTPQDKAVPYLIVVIVVGIVIWILIGVISAAIIGAGAMMGAATMGG